MVAKKLATVAVGLFVLTAAYSPAFAGSAAPTTQGTVQTANGTAMTGGLNSIFADSVQHPTAKACKQDTLYSQHDVIGDPDSCIMNRFDARISTTSAVGGVVP